MGKDIVGYDITIPKTTYDDQWQLGNMLKGWCKKFVFQLEKSETGYLHWQCRVHLMKPKTMGTVIATVAPDVKGNWSPTSNTVHQKGSFNYCMKRDTREEGPWTDEDFDEPPKLTRQLKAFMEQPLRPWQETVEKLVTDLDDRYITMIYDDVGNTGKSIFAEYLEYKQVAFELPCLRAFEDIMQFAFSFKDQKCYIIDMPRALKKDKMSEFYSGLECLKNGVVWDKRYGGKKRRMDRPQILVFTNTMPTWGYMSLDRWRVYCMDESYSLTELDIQEATSNLP